MSSVLAAQLDPPHLLRNLSLWFLRIAQHKELVSSLALGQADDVLVRYVICQLFRPQEIPEIERRVIFWDHIAPVLASALIWLDPQISAPCIQQQKNQLLAQVIVNGDIYLIHHIIQKLLYVNGLVAVSPRVDPAVQDFRIEPKPQVTLVEMYLQRIFNICNGLRVNISGAYVKPKMEWP